MTVPIRVMSNVVYSDAVVRTILNRLKAVAPDPADAGLLNGAKVGLFTGVLAPSRNTTLAEVVAAEANFTGYARSAAVTFGNSLTDDNGNSGCVGPSVQFTATDGASQNTVTGAFLANGAGDALLCACRFDQSVTVDAANDGLVVVPQFDWVRIVE